MLSPADDAYLCDGEYLTAKDLPSVIRPDRALQIAQRMWRSSFHRSQLLWYCSFGSSRSDSFPSELRSAINSGSVIFLERFWQTTLDPVALEKEGEWQLNNMEHEPLLFRSVIERAMHNSGLGAGGRTAVQKSDARSMSFADAIAANQKFLDQTNTEPKTFYVDLQCLWDNGEAVGEIPLLLTFADGEAQRHTLPANGHLYIENAPSSTYKVQLLPEESDAPVISLRTEIQNTLNQIITNEQAEAARHQAQQDQMNMLENGLTHTGAVIWGIWQWGRDTVVGLKEIADLSNPAVIINNTIKAAYHAQQADPAISWVQRFTDEFSHQQHRELVEALGLDPNQIRKEQLAQAYDIASFALSDRPTRANLLQFGKDYIAAQDSIELAEGLAPAAMDTALTAILTALTGVGGAVLIAKSGSTLIIRLGKQLIKLGKLLKQIQLKKPKAQKLSNKKQQLQIRRPRPEKVSEPKKVEGEINDGTMQEANNVPKGLTSAQRIEKLDLEGHAPVRHGGSNRVTDLQLEDRAVRGIDPASGTKLDAFNRFSDGRPKLHKVGRNATAFVSDDSLLQADDFVRNSIQFQQKVATAKMNGDLFVDPVEIPLKDVFGNSYQNHVRGVTRLGSKSNPTGHIPTDFTDGTLKAIYRVDQKGDVKLHTLYPNPKP